jgi:hypothetical protein
MLPAFKDILLSFARRHRKFLPKPEHRCGYGATVADIVHPLHARATKHHICSKIAFIFLGFNLIVITLNKEHTFLPFLSLTCLLFGRSRLNWLSDNGYLTLGYQPQ